MEAVGGKSTNYYILGEGGLVRIRNVVFTLLLPPPFYLSDTQSTNLLVIFAFVFFILPVIFIIFFFFNRFDTVVNCKYFVKDSIE